MMTSPISTHYISNNSRKLSGEKSASATKRQAQTVEDCLGPALPEARKLLLLSRHCERPSQLASQEHGINKASKCSDNYRAEPSYSIKLTEAQTCTGPGLPTEQAEPRIASMCASVLHGRLLQIQAPASEQHPLQSPQGSEDEKLTGQVENARSALKEDQQISRAFLMKGELSTRRPKTNGI